MIQLVALGGTGDVYLVCALLAAFRRHHGRGDVRVLLRSKFSAIADLFGEPYDVDDALVARAEADLDMQANYDNRRLAGGPFYTHPCFLKSSVRVDRLTTKPDASQADMYRMILGIPVESPLTLPPNVPRPLVEPNSVLIIRDAVSWPNTQPRFWSQLQDALSGAGRSVVVNNKVGWSLQELLARCAASEWVIGPQCGVMSILCTARFPCRKTLATPSVDDDRAPSFLASETYPYAYVTKFSNDDYDVEEFKITHHNRADMVAAIAGGANAQRLWPHDPAPVLTLHAPLMPGDAIDRLAVLTVKRDRFSPPRRAAIEREYQRYLELTRVVRLSPAITGLFERLIINHEAAFDLLERMIPAAYGHGDIDPADHVTAIRANRERFELKQEIDRACRAPYTEEKSYYDAPGSCENHLGASS